KQMVRAVVASTVGTSIEWYDYFLFGTMGALVFAKLFFPKSDPLTGTLNTYAIFFAGFLARPVGAWLFGTYGDRIGRKATLIATLLLMGIATFLIGFMPTYSSIGLWAAVILVVLRLCQGIGVGGEWGGSVLMSMEWGSQKRKGFLGSWPQFGVPVGLFLATVVTLITQNLTGASFLTWGWRVPFLLSIILVGVGLYIRLGILETPVFQKVLAEERVVRVPVWEALKRQPKQIALTALVRMPEQAPGYIVATFIFTYGTTVLGASRDFLLSAILVQAVLGFTWVVIAGYLSDHVGRKKMYMIGAVISGLWGFVYFGMLDTKVPWLIFLGVALSLLPIMNLYGPQAALIAESFSPRLSYTATS